MSLPLLLLRPQPGNDASAKRARAMGLDAIQLPLFETERVDSEPLPEGPFDAVLITSANGARFAPELVAAMAHLPLYVVGEASAQAVQAQGHADVRIGGGDGGSTAAMIAADGHAHVLHICGADVRPFDSHGLAIVRHPVYRAAERDAAEVKPLLETPAPAVAAVHSPRAGARLAELVSPERRAAIHIAAISQAAAQSCGAGWASLAVSAAPHDTALLACAKALCIRAV